MPACIKCRVNYPPPKPKPAPPIIVSRGCKPGADRGRPWTPAEIAKLGALCDTMSVKEASRYFPDRTLSAITHRASTSGFSRKFK